MFWILMEYKVKALSVTKIDLDLDLTQWKWFPLSTGFYVLPAGTFP